MKIAARVLCFGLALCASQAAWSQSRANNRVGLGLGILSDPVPSLISYQLKYNIVPALQVGVSYGSVSASGSSIDPNTGLATGASGGVTTYGVSAKAFLIPSWSLSPYVNAGFARTKIDGSFSIGGSTVSSASGSLNSIVAGVGLDHQAFIGFNIGAGVNYIIAPSEISDAVKILPHVYFGWFFF
jgi:opacity protein-like surface antigen